MKVNYLLMRYKRFVKDRKKTVDRMSADDFKKLKYLGWQAMDKKFDSLVIVPTDTIHDSGYRCMSFVPTKRSIPLGRLSGCSDVIHLDGIGGYGCADWAKRFGKVPDAVPPKGWMIDCLPKTGYLRIFASGKLEAGVGMSSFEVFCVKDCKEKEDGS